MEDGDGGDPGDLNKIGNDAVRQRKPGEMPHIFDVYWGILTGEYGHESMPLLHYTLDLAVVIIGGIIVLYLSKKCEYIFRRINEHEGLPYAGGGDADPLGGAREIWSPPALRGLSGEGDSPPRARRDRRVHVQAIQSSSSSSSSSPSPSTSRRPPPSPPTVLLHCHCQNSANFNTRGKSSLATRGRSRSRKRNVWFCSCVSEARGRRRSSYSGSPQRCSPTLSPRRLPLPRLSHDRILPPNFAGGRRLATRRSELNAPVTDNGSRPPTTSCSDFDTPAPGLALPSSSIVLVQHCRCQNSANFNTRGKSCLATRSRSRNRKRNVWFCSCVLEGHAGYSSYSGSSRRRSSSLSPRRLPFPRLSHDRILPPNFAGGRRLATRRSELNAPVTDNGSRPPTTSCSDFDTPTNNLEPIGNNIPILGHVQVSEASEDTKYETCSLELTVSGGSLSSSSYPSDPETLSTHESLHDDQPQIAYLTEASGNTDQVDLLSDSEQPVSAIPEELLDFSDTKTFIEDPQELSDLYEIAEENPQHSHYHTKADKDQELSETADENQEFISSLDTETSINCSSEGSLLQPRGANPKKIMVNLFHHTQ